MREGIQADGTYVMTRGGIEILNYLFNLSGGFMDPPTSTFNARLIGDRKIELIYFERAGKGNGFKDGVRITLTPDPEFDLFRVNPDKSQILPHIMPKMITGRNAA